jgi:hypothetical protein
VIFPVPTLQGLTFNVDNEVLYDGNASAGLDLLEFPMLSLPANKKQMMVNLALGSTSMQMHNLIPALHSFGQSGGIFGIGYEGISGFSCAGSGGRPSKCLNIEKFMMRLFPNETIPEDQYIVGMNFDPYGPSWADIGGASSTYRNNISWGELGSTQLRLFHGFQMYHPQICGVDILSEFASSWGVELDTESSCLGLPTEFFDVIMSHVQASCVNGSTLDGFSSRTCYVNSNQKEFPVITFSMDDAQSSTLYIAIEDLILPSQFDSQGGRRLCIVEKYPLAQSNIAYPNKRIIFGAKALSSVYTLLDFNHTRVGFSQGIRARQTSTSLANSKLNCAIPLTEASCGVGQVLNKYLNKCEPKVCSNYYLYDVDMKTGNCKIVSWNLSTFLSLTRCRSGIYVCWINRICSSDVDVL